MMQIAAASAIGLTVGLIIGGITASTILRAKYEARMSQKIARHGGASFRLVPIDDLK